MAELVRLGRGARAHGADAGETVPRELLTTLGSGNIHVGVGDEYLLSSLDITQCVELEGERAQGELEFGIWEAAVCEVSICKYE